MESWKLVLRKGIVPNLTSDDLAILLHGLKTDDIRIIQGHTTTPLPLLCVHDWPCEAADPIGYVRMMQAGRAATVGDVEEHFARLCYECDKLMGELSACRWFITWMDDTPRHEMRAELIKEIERAIAAREAKDADDEELEQSHADAEKGYWQATDEAVRELAARELVLAGVEVYDDCEADLDWQTRV